MQTTPIAIRRQVHKGVNPFRTGMRVRQEAGGIAILGAEIDGRVARRLATLEDRLEFALVVIGKEDGMMGKRHAGRLSQTAGDKRRQ